MSSSRRSLARCVAALVDLRAGDSEAAGGGAEGGGLEASRGNRALMGRVISIPEASFTFARRNL